MIRQIEIDEGAARRTAADGLSCHPEPRRSRRRRTARIGTGVAPCSDDPRRAGRNPLAASLAEGHKIWRRTAIRWPRQRWLLNFCDEASRRTASRTPSICIASCLNKLNGSLRQQNTRGNSRRPAASANYVHVTVAITASPRGTPCWRTPIECKLPT